MFVITLVGLVPAGIVGWWRVGTGVARVRDRGGDRRRSRSWPGCRCRVRSAVGVEPHDAYREQFRPMLEPERPDRRTPRLLALECLPRLIVGHRLPGLQADPDPRALAGPGPTSRDARRAPGRRLGVTAVGADACSAVARRSLARRRAADEPAARAVCWGLLVSAAAVVAGFVVNRNIFNSDNYRYLVMLLVPWALGFGLAMRRPGAAGQGRARGRLALLALVLAALMTVDTARWYARFGWIDLPGPAGAACRSTTPRSAWLDAHPEVTADHGRLLGRLPPGVPDRRAGARRRRCRSTPTGSPNGRAAWPGGSDTGARRPGDAGRVRRPCGRRCGAGGRVAVARRGGSRSSSDGRERLSRPWATPVAKPTSARVQRIAGLAGLRAAPLGPGRPGRARWSGPRRSPPSSGTPSACRRPSSTSTSPRSTIPIATSSPTSCGPAGSRAGARGSTAGLPLYSESQAGYLHPLKYLLYPWLATWKAFNLDTVLSVWLTGVGDLRLAAAARRAAGALTGAAVFGLSGFVWAHLSTRA